MGINFALLISQLTASLSSGVITTDIITISQSILQLEVTALPSPAIVGLLQSALSTAQSLQISILAQMTNIQLKITELYSSSLSSVSFTITAISASGETSQLTVSALPVSSSSSQAAFQTSQAALERVESLVLASLSLDFSAIPTASTEVSSTQFLLQVSSFLLELGTNVISDNVLPLSQDLLQLKITTQLSQSTQSKVQFILYLIGICERMILDIIAVLSTPAINNLSTPTLLPANDVSISFPRPTTAMSSIRISRPTAEMSSIGVPTSTRQRPAL